MRTAVPRYDRPRDPAARGAGRRARRADRDPVGERRPGARGRHPPCGGLGRRADPRGRGHGRDPGAGRAAARRRRGAAPRPAPDAPTVLVYAHLDVQPPDPLELWESDPWTLIERDGWLVARGVADDKAHLFMLLEATRLLAAAGELPGDRALRDRRARRRSAGTRWSTGSRRTRAARDVALILDGGYATRRCRRSAPRSAACATSTSPSARRARPPLGHVRRRGAQRDARADADALRRAPGAGRAPARAAARGHRAADRGASSRAGRRFRPAPRSSPPTGARPIDARAAEEFQLRTTAEPSVDVNGVEGGSPRLQKTVLPVEAQANVSIRLAPGQTTADDRRRCSSGCCARRRRRARPSRSSSGRRASRATSTRRRRDRALAQDAFEHVARRAAGARPLGRLDSRRRRARRARRPADRHRVRAGRRPRCTPRTSTSPRRRCATGSDDASRCCAGSAELG